MLVITLTQMNNNRLRFCSNCLKSQTNKEKAQHKARPYFFQLEFPASQTLSRRLSRHWTLIYTAAAGKLTTEPRGRVFRRQFLLLFRERKQIRGLSGILEREVCEMSHSNYSIPSAFEAQARLIRNSLRLRRSGSLSRTPSAISSYIPFGIGTVPRAPLEFTTTNRDSPSSSK